MMVNPSHFNRFQSGIELIPVVEFVGEARAENSMGELVEVLKFIVHSGKRSYYVYKDLYDHYWCQCPDHIHRGSMCKHIYAVVLWMFLERTKGQTSFEGVKHEEKRDTTEQRELFI